MEGKVRQGAQRFHYEVGATPGSAVIDSSVHRHQTCIDSCNKCAQACEECLTSCIKEPDAQSRVACMSALRDCAEICMTAVTFMASGSPYAQEVCMLCATICEACAEECGKFQDTHCQQCARDCQECAEECRRMVAA